eukprot:2525456-Karenia_brevis.AAC.1
MSAGHAGFGFASMRTHSTPVKSSDHAGDGSASMRTYSTPVKSDGHAGDGLALSGHAWPDFSDAVLMEKPSDEVVFLPTHTTSNPRTGKVFTVEMHHQRVELANLADNVLKNANQGVNVGLNIRGLDKNNMLPSGD